MSDLTSAVMASDFGRLFWLLVGGGVVIVATLVVDYFRHEREKKQVTIAVYTELANRLARCTHDHIDPWSEAWDTDKAEKFRGRWPHKSLKKFLAQAPMVFPSLGPSIALLDTKAISPLIDFYFRLDAWNRDLSAIAETEPLYNAKHVQWLIYRLGETLKPGSDALNALKRSIDEPESIDKDICRSFDNLEESLEIEVGKRVSCFEKHKLEMRNPKDKQTDPDE